MIDNFLKNEYGISEEIIALSKKADAKAKEAYEKIERIYYLSWQTKGI